MTEDFRGKRGQVPKKLQTVVLVGRPNVGKSTLFNRITGIRRAIVAPIAGTTRDVNSSKAEWGGVRFLLTDTGGMFGASEDPLHDMVSARGQRALQEASVVVFVADAVSGALPADQEVAEALRGSGKPVVLAVNKSDDRRAQAGTLEFHRLGFEPVIAISAEHGRGIGDLLEEVIARLGSRPAPVTEPAGEAADAGEEADSAAPPRDERPDVTAVAIVGRPNVGKSSLVNRMLREERVLVSPMPGTTRDAIDTELQWRKRRFRIVDTAGIRRPGSVARSGAVERVSAMQSKRAIERAEVVVLVLDSVEGATDQDAAIAGAADKAGRGLIVAANKWDLLKDGGPPAARKFDDELARQMKFLDYAPVIHISARTGERVPKLLETIDRVSERRRRRVPSGELNRFVRDVTAANPPVSPGRREVRVMYATQVAIAPPTFVFFTNVATTFHFSYERFLVNRLREAFGFEGSPIRIEVRARSGRR
ncbi:MAG: ribosome biogenesis GTPase Der [Vicinamibacterales bacterium]|jgi:GTP-binding protein|nr:ribosome biogenesis GTPase Der [Vicinamibacterales bacterium]